MSAAQGVSRSEAVLKALDTTWQTAQEVTTTHLIPALKYTADKLVVAWKEVSPLLQKTVESQVGLGGVLIGFSLTVLSISLLAAKKSFKFAFALMAIGVILGGAGMILLSSAGALPVITVLV